MLETFVITAIVVIFIGIIFSLLFWVADKLNERTTIVIIFTLIFIILFCLVHDFRNSFTQNTATAEIK